MKNSIFLSALLIMSLPTIYGMDDADASTSTSQSKSDDALTQKLLEAIYDEDSTLVDKALKAGAQPNRVHIVWDEFDRSPFLRCNEHPMATAYLSGKLDIVELLEENGGVLEDSEDESGGDTRNYKTGVIEQLVMEAVRNNGPLLDHLIQKSEDTIGSYEPHAFMAVCCNNLACVKALVDNGFNYTKIFIDPKNSKFGSSLLLKAAEEGYTDILKYFAEQGLEDNDIENTLVKTYIDDEARTYLESLLDKS